MPIIRSAETLRFLATLAIALVIAVLALSCAPASNEAGMDGMDMAGMAPGESDVDLKIGETAPPFAMTLADGAEVSSASLAEKGRPAHLFWFATW